MNVFFLYQLIKTEWDTKEILLRVTWEHIVSTDEDEIELEKYRMDRKRDAMLRQVLKTHNFKKYRLLGSFDGTPKGDDLYAQYGGFEVELWYVTTTLGKTKIVLSQAETEWEFYQMLESGDVEFGDYAIYPAERVHALFHTEKDFQLEKEKIDKKATKELEGLYYDSEEATMQLYMKKLFFQMFLEEGWSFEKVYEILDHRQKVMKVWNQPREYQPLIIVSYDSYNQNLSISLQAIKWAKDPQNLELGFACRNGMVLHQVLKSLLYYKDCFDYDSSMDYKIYGYEKMLLKLKEQGITPRIEL